MMKSFAVFLRDESGNAAVEYSVFAAGILISILVTIKGIGPKLYGVFSAIAVDLPGVIAVGP